MQLAVVGKIIKKKGVKTVIIKGVVKENSFVSSQVNAKN